MIYFTWPSGAGGDFLMSLGLILTGKVNEITFDKRNFQFFHPKSIAYRYDDVYIETNLDSSEFEKDLTDTKYILGHDNFGINYSVDYSLFDKVVHIRAEDYFTLSYISALYWTKVVAYDAMKDGWEHNPFDFRHTYQENWKINQHHDVTNINYAALFYKTDYRAIERLFSALDMPLTNEQVELAAKCLKVYKDANDHHLVQKTYINDYPKELITLKNDSPVILLWEFCDTVKDLYHPVEIDYKFIAPDGDDD